MGHVCRSLSTPSLFPHMECLLHQYISSISSTYRNFLSGNDSLYKYQINIYFKQVKFLKCVQAGNWTQNDWLKLQCSSNWFDCKYDQPKHFSQTIFWQQYLVCLIYVPLPVVYSIYKAEEMLLTKGCLIKLLYCFSLQKG